MSTVQDQQGYNWGNGQQDPNYDPDDIYIPEMTATRSADEIAQGFHRDIARPGDFDFVITGFLHPKVPEVSLDLFHQGRPVSCTCRSIGVVLSNLDDLGERTILWLRMPPDDPRTMPYYLEGSRNQEGKGAGMEANKLVYFVNRIGFTWGVGQPMPPEARNLKNWKGRKVRGTVEESYKSRQNRKEGRVDPSTNQPYPPEYAVNEFSFRAYDPAAPLQQPPPLLGSMPQASAGSPQSPAGSQQPAAPAPGPTQPVLPQGPQPAPQPRPSPPQGPQPSAARRSLVGL
jgi:hypothetical protein